MLHRLLPRSPRVSSETWSANRRTVDALVKTSALGDMPKFVFEALDTGGEEAAYEVSDLFQQLDARDPQKSKVLGASVNSLLLQKRAKSEAKAPNTQTAFAPAVPFLLGGAADALGTGEVLRRMIERRRQKALPNRPPRRHRPQCSPARPGPGQEPAHRNHHATAADRAAANPHRPLHANPRIQQTASLDRPRSHRKDYGNDHTGTPGKRGYKSSNRRYSRQGFIPAAPGFDSRGDSQTRYSVIHCPEPQGRVCDVEFDLFTG